PVRQMVGQRGQDRRRGAVDHEGGRHPRHHRRQESKESGLRLGPATFSLSPQRNPKSKATGTWLPRKSSSIAMLARTSCAAAISWPLPPSSASPPEAGTS